MAWEQLYRERFDAVGDAGLTESGEAPQTLVRYPPIDGLRPSQLAERLELSKQATNDVLRDFEAMGILRLERDPTDGRARIVRFTDRGWRWYEADAEVSRRVGERWAAQIGEERYRAVVSGLEAIVGVDAELGADGSAELGDDRGGVEPHVLTADQPVAELEHVQDAKTDAAPVARNAQH